MNGISSVISKPCCPMYNFGTISNLKYCTSNKIIICTSNKTNLFPCRLSNLLHQRNSSSVATKPMVKHRAYSSCAGKDAMASRFEAPEVSSTVVTYGLFGLLGIIGLTLPKAWDVVAQFVSAMVGKEGLLKLSASYYIVLGVGAVFAFKGFLSNIICGFLVLHDNPFETGDIIEVGYLDSQVTEIGLITTSLITPENYLLVIPTSWFYGQAIVNKSRNITIVPYSFLGDQVVVKKPPVALYHVMNSKIYMDIDDDERLLEISQELKKMMISNSNVYLEKRQPSCQIAIFEGYIVLTLVCYLKQASEDELYLVKQEILLLSAQIIKNHGAKLVGTRGN